MQGGRGGIAGHCGLFRLAQLAGVVPLPDGAPVVVGQAVGGRAGPPPRPGSGPQGCRRRATGRPRRLRSRRVARAVDVPPADPAPGARGIGGRAVVPAAAAAAAAVPHRHFAHALVHLAVVARASMFWRIMSACQASLSMAASMAAAAAALVTGSPEVPTDKGRHPKTAVGVAPDVPKPPDHFWGHPCSPHRPGARRVDCGPAAVACHVVHYDVPARNDDFLDVGHLPLGERVPLGQAGAVAGGGARRGGL